MNYYEIRRALKPGVNLTVAQRSSSLFAEEPTVMGIVLRRGLPPMKITEEQYERNKVHLVRLESAGAIEITKHFASVPVETVSEGSTELPPPPPENPPTPEAPAAETKPEPVVEAPVEPVVPAETAPVAEALATEVKVEESVEVKVDEKKSKKKGKE